MDFTLDNAPSESERDSVKAWLREFNFSENNAFMQHVTTVEDQEISVTAKAESGEVVGGVLAETRLDWVSINIMAVDPEYRGHGIGTRVLQEAERIAISMGCKRSIVDTMEYQAPDFYRKNGYRDACRLPNWDSHGHDKFLLIKDLVEA